MEVTEWEKKKRGKKTKTTKRTDFHVYAVNQIFTAVRQS